MIKTIKIVDFQIQDIVISRQDGELIADVRYTALAEDGDFTYSKTVRLPVPKQTLVNFEKAIMTKVKERESI